MQASDASVPLLDMRGIHKRFGAFEALRGVDFDLYPGEIHALLGENGAGKSTLVKILAGALSASQGEIRIAGRAVTFSSVGDAQSHGIAMVYQELALAPDLSIAENLFLGQLPSFVNHRELALRAKPLMDQVQLDAPPTTPVRALSVGAQQLIEIARALGREGRILVLDEPTAALSGSDAERLFDILDKLRKRGVGVIYISHRLEEVFALADRVTVLRDGQRVLSERVASLTPEVVIEAMVGQAVRRLERPTSIRSSAPPLRLGYRATELEPGEISVRPGEIVGLAGVVGSGRSKVLSALFGADGSATWNDDPIASPAAAIARGAALVPEDRKAQGLVLDLTVRENLTLAILKQLTRFGLLRHGLERREARTWVERLGVRPPEPEKRVIELSGGNQQKVVLGKALASTPRVLLLDEPTRGVDVGARQELYRLLDDLARDGLSLLIASSDTEELTSLCDRILVFRRGRVSAEIHRPFRHEEVVAHVTGAKVA